MLWAIAVNDGLLLGLLVLVLLVSTGSAVAGFGRDDQTRLVRVERKLDMILAQLGVEFVDPASPASLSAESKAIYERTGSKIAAIKQHRAETGIGLKKAKAAIDGYIESISQ
mgnify:CR=1 FL=1